MRTPPGCRRWPRPSISAGCPGRDWFLDAGTFDLPPSRREGVFYNRMSASSHTRDHRYAAELTAAVLAWLTRWGRRVVNGPGALDLEISKARQYAALEATASPRRAPSWWPAATASSPPRASISPTEPVILKPNRGGKGLGVRLFHSSDSLAAYLAGPDYEAPVDGIHLLQEYVRAPRPLITRAEFVGGRFLYAVEVDTSDGFELCPADACAVGDAICPVGEAPREKFTIIDGIPDALRERLERFLCADRRGGGRHRVHHRHRRPHAGLRCEHQHQLQPGGGGARRPRRHCALRARRHRTVPWWRAGATVRGRLNALRPDTPVRAYGALAGTTLMLLNGEPLISLVLTTV